MRQDDIGLLDDLVAVYDQRMEMEQQRIVLLRTVLEIPFFSIEKLIILRVDAEL
jgi:hypothetical protein